MKQMIAKSRKEAIKFAEGGNGKTQRAAYWLQGKIINRAEVIPGQKIATIKENVGGHWWDAKTTIAQKFERNHISSAAALMGSAKSDKKSATSRENGKLGGRPKDVKVLIKNQFHNTEKVFSIKSSYFGNDPDFDALTALEYQIYSGGNDIEYAKKKQAEIKKALCGQSDCRCGCKIVKIL